MACGKTSQIVRQTGVQLILDLNLVTSTPALAARWAQIAVRNLPPGGVTGSGRDELNHLASLAGKRATITAGATRTGTAKVSKPGSSTRAGHRVQPESPNA